MCEQMQCERAATDVDYFKGHINVGNSGIGCTSAGEGGWLLIILLYTLHQIQYILYMALASWESIRRTSLTLVGSLGEGFLACMCRMAQLCICCCRRHGQMA